VYPLCYRADKRKNEWLIVGSLLTRGRFTVKIPLILSIKWTYSDYRVALSTLCWRTLREPQNWRLFLVAFATIANTPSRASAQTLETTAASASSSATGSSPSATVTPTTPGQSEATGARQQLPPPSDQAKVNFYGLYRFRLEDWNWFPTPKANGAYTFETSVLRLGVTRTSPLDDFTLEIEQPAIIGVPHNASGSGSIGSLGYGPSYYAANHNQSAGFFIKQLFARFKRLGNNPDASFQVGRFTFSDGTETTPADPTLAFLKQTRINDRLISEAFYSNLGRSFDGVRFSNNARLENTTAFFASPTRGAYDLNGWDTLANIQVGYLARTFTQTGPRDSAEGRLFSIYYADEREQDVKVDNRTTAARTADTKGIHMGVFGGNYVRSFQLGPGRVDGLLWGAGEIGSWGHLSQAAYAYDGELGYQFTHAAWKPWLRLGYSVFSGDGNAKDSVHGTYIPLLTTALKYAPFPFFTQSNLKELFGQVIVRPDKKLTVRAEVRGLKLANSNDLWYTGSGAYEQFNFGYSGRTSGGNVNLGTLYDLIADYNLVRNLTLSFFLGYVQGGDVETATFSSKDADYAYLQLLYRF
jgi:hypothetical protein